MNLNFNDFQKQDIKFDVNKLQNAYKELLTIKGFSGVDGVSNFGAISLTQIPGDPDSIKGNKARGVFWTKPDSSGKEASFPEESGLVQNTPLALLPLIESGSPGICVNEMAPKFETPSTPEKPLMVNNSL